MKSFLNNLPEEIFSRERVLLLAPLRHDALPAGFRFGAAANSGTLI